MRLRLTKQRISCSTQIFKMDAALQTVLTNAGLGTLCDVFHREKIGVNEINNLSEEELNNLGVVSMGDRHRLKSAARRHIDVTSQTQRSLPLNHHTGHTHESRDRQGPASREVAALFAPYRSRATPYTASANRRNRRGMQKERTWTGNFFCFPERDRACVATFWEKEMLAKSGLGAKKIQLLQHDTSEEVYKKLQNAYPALNGCGGFELMRAQGHGRSLVAINPCYAVSNLKSSGSQGTFYIRPVQQDLILQQSLENDQEIKVKEACLKCGRMYDLTALRGHHAACQPAAHGNEEIQSVTAVVIDPQDSDVVVLLGEEDDTDTDLPDLAAAASDVLLGEEDDTDTDLPEPLFAAAASLSEEDLLENVIKECISICQDDNVTNPIEILRVAQRKIVTGRKLDIDASAMTTGLTGNTNFISIDRDSVVDSAFDALADVPLKDLRLCLEVNFIGEKASDYGGPRKEFFQSVLLAIKETFFDNIRPQSEHYETIGKIMALSTLQNGRLPRIMTPELCEEVFKTPTNETREFVKDLRRGLDSLGLLRICDAFPTFRNLFTPIDQPKLTLKKMTQLLKPKMSPEGSNKHKQEMKVMKNFLAYLKEVSAGRRNNGNVTLAKVLRFVTAEEQEPPLGYEMNPSIEFKVMPSWYPTASSCGNILFLTAYGEMPERQRMFEIFDMAFDTPQHFGLT